MIRLGGGPGDPSSASADPAEERRAATSAVVGNTAIFAIVVALVNAAPYVLEQFGVEVLK